MDDTDTAMHLNQLPPEVLNLILKNLMKVKSLERREAPDPIGPGFLIAARQVCRTWNALATPHLFRTVSLTHNEQGTFHRWNAMMDSEMVRQAVQHAIIYSAPFELAPGRNYEIWEAYEEEGEYPDFEVAIGRINELPNLKSLTLSFSDMCYGVASDRPMEEDYEVTETRQACLKFVFKTLQERGQAGEVITIPTLTIANLQNMPIPDITTSDTFRNALKPVKSLHLLIADEVNEHGPDYDIECVERWTYEPHLQNELLPPLTEQLTSLSLGFTEEWGVAPGYFDGKGLNFPRLKSLHLSNFMIGHHDQFDWVLGMSQLTSLRLTSCAIPSHLRIYGHQPRLWGLKTHDWVKQPRGAFGFTSDDDYVYTFDKTWESIFDDIRTRLPKLIDLRMHYANFTNFYHPDLVELQEGLSPQRYIVLDTGLLPSPWIDARGYGSGALSFGNNVAAPVDLESTENHYIEKGKLNRAEETKEGDDRALQDLLKAIRERW